jgi:hypothetical protein
MRIGRRKIQQSLPSPPARPARPAAWPNSFSFWPTRASLPSPLPLGLLATWPAQPAPLPLLGRSVTLARQAIPAPRPSAPFLSPGPPRVRPSANAPRPPGQSGLGSRASSSAAQRRRPHPVQLGQRPHLAQRAFLALPSRTVMRGSTAAVRNLPMRPRPPHESLLAPGFSVEVPLSLSLSLSLSPPFLASALRQGPQFVGVA